MTSPHRTGTTKRVPFESLPDNSPFIKPPFDISPFRDLYPYRSRWVRRNGMNIHYLDEGYGEPLVCVHGNPTWSFYYRSLVSALSPNYRLVIPDHMGCGLSSRPTEDAFTYTLESHVDNLEDLLDHLGLMRDVTLVVHDWGGMIGMACACRRPERINRIVVLNTGAFMIPKEKKLPWPLSFVKNIPLLPTILIRGLNAFAMGASFLGTRKGLTPDVRRALTAPYNTWQNRLATLRFVQDIPLSPKDKSYQLAAWVDSHIRVFQDRPLLICWGERDFVFDGIILKEWQKRFPKAEVYSFPDGGHYILEDYPDQVSEKMLDFFRRHPL
ncbi:MAG: Cis-3-alkyl-4-alkyloxetan-2-one decarboxylase [Syntrophus sp. SKADARSKE-3]|nr:Cis-3-alkyl-4-alkyloxetan-2-one decarboxylase [Syntrophus sp. SKADARSKE-3]